MEDKNLFPHSGAKERSSDPFFSFGSNLKQSLSYGPGIRHPKIWAKLNHPFCDSGIIRSDSYRPILDVLLHIFIDVYNLPFHF